jgi:hypothetical protein
MITKIPVSFEFDGQMLTGSFGSSSTMGAGSMWQLYLNKPGYQGVFYYGILHLTQEGWRFSGNTAGMDKFIDYFSDVVRAWYE